MHEAFKVAKWEFSQNLKDKQFLFVTFLIPIIMLGTGALAVWMSSMPVRELPYGGRAPLDAPEELKAMLDKVVSVGFAFLFMFVALMSGTLVAQNVIKEKQSRVVEILLSSISPQKLMAGKILGFGGLGLVQAAIWASMALFLLFGFGSYLGLPAILEPGLLKKLPWGKVLLYLPYFVLGYLLIASLSAGIGATMKDYLSGNQLLVSLLLLPAMLPFMLYGLILTDPHHIIVRTFSFVPPTMPGVIMLRTSAASVPSGEIVATLVVLAFSVLLAMRLAGKIFQTGVLLYGKSASLKEIWRWMRA